MNLQLIRETAEQLALHDVSLSDSTVSLGSAFDPINEYAESTLNITYGPRDGTLATLETADKRAIKRWIVQYGAQMRNLNGALEEVDPASISPEILLAEINVSFAVQFFLKEGAQVSQEGLNEFTQHNVVHLIWPYIREFLHNVCARARLPLITLHMSMPSNSKAAASIEG